MRAPRSFFLVLTLGLVLEPRIAHAYIDPGTGSALFYVVAGVVVSIYFAIRGLYYRLIEAVFRMRHREQSCQVAIHCEDPRYEITFVPVLRELVARGIRPTFLTMYPRGASFETLPDEVTHHAIAPGMIGYAYLNHIEAVVLATTTPQLDVMTFRRSPRVRHYVMVQHALGEGRYVRPYAYDYFDSVFCCGEILKKNIRRMESIRGSVAKELHETGLPHYEALIASRDQDPRPAGPTCVLVAPSWGPLSMFEAYGTDFVAAIAQRFTVIVRPHPQMKASQPELYARILAIPGVEVDTSRTPFQAMARAHILLSDISGIAHEFAFIHERPVVVVDRHIEPGGLEGEVLGGASDLVARCRDFIVPIPGARIGEVADELDRVLRAHSPEQLRRVRDELIYHFGNASKVAADQIVMIYEREIERQRARQMPQVPAQAAQGHL
jgi:hypothetical protein